MKIFVTKFDKDVEKHYVIDTQNNTSIRKYPAKYRGSIVVKKECIGVRRNQFICPDGEHCHYFSEETMQFLFKELKEVEYIDETGRSKLKRKLDDLEKAKDNLVSEIQLLKNEIY